MTDIDTHVCPRCGWPALTCQPHGRDRLQGHVWTSANVDAPCKCDQAVTWRQLMAARPQRPPTRHAATAGRRKGGR